MHSKRVIGALGAVFLCACFVSVKAESVLDWQLMNETHRESFRLDFPDINRSESFGYFRNEESDNGRHLGFFSTSNLQHRGPLIGVADYNPVRTTSVMQNPEPTTMVLLGTGLVAIAGYARRLKRKRQS